MDENVAHRGEESPRNFWKCLAGFGREAARGFADDLEFAVHRLVFLLVGLETFARDAVGETADSLGRFKDVSR